MATEQNPSPCDRKEKLKWQHRKNRIQKPMSSADEMVTQLPYDEFNLPIPERFPEKIMTARAAKAIVHSECWTDANPMLNLSSFVTTFCEPEAREIFAEGSFRNFADPDMYPHTKDTEFTCVRWLHDLWNGPQGRRTVWFRHHRIFRGLHAGRPGAQVELARSPEKGGKGFQSAQHGHRGQRPDRLEEVPALFRRRTPHRSFKARAITG